MLNPDLLRRPGTVLLDASCPGHAGENDRCLLFTGPVREHVAHTHEEVRSILRALDRAVDEGYYVAGAMTYEAGWAFMPEAHTPAARRRPSPAPLAWFGVYTAPTRLHPATVEAGLSRLMSNPGLTSNAGTVPLIKDVQLAYSRDAYRQSIAAIREHIREGDVYQINYTGPVHAQNHGDPLLLYAALRARQRVHYGAYLNMNWSARTPNPPDAPSRHVLSFSPELFFRRSGSQVTTRPMKGTIRRGCTLAEDCRLQDALTHDPKNRAENLMIVDLLRNDLSVCCEPGTVHVPELFTAESYETVTQMTSTVEGTLRAGTTYADLFAALFPCGSITGAPKLRAMQIIDALEAASRGLYCGAIGYAGPNDEATFNVAIRTLVLDEIPGPPDAPVFRGQMGVGSGIVWDSNAAAEYDECLLKTQFLSGLEDAPTEDFKLIETMHWADGQIALLDRHLARLAASAAYFRFRFDGDAVRASISALGQEAADQEAAESGTHSGGYKVRVTLDRWGHLDGSVAPLAPRSAEPWRITLAEERIDAGDPFFYHKTTRRTLYERAYQAARQQGFDEALLLNARGELTEGTRTNVFVDLDGQLWTPPVECGLLDGVYRQHVLAMNPGATERILTLDDLRAADAIYCCNAVQGWQPAAFVAPVGAAGP